MKAYKQAKRTKMRRENEEQENGKKSKTEINQFKPF